MKRYSYTLMILILSAISLIYLAVMPTKNYQIDQVEAGGDQTYANNWDIDLTVFSQEDDKEYFERFALTRNGILKITQNIFSTVPERYLSPELADLPFYQRPKNRAANKVTTVDNATLFIETLRGDEEHRELPYVIYNRMEKKFKEFQYHFKTDKVELYPINHITYENVTRLFFQKSSYEPAESVPSSADSMVYVDINMVTGQVIKESQIEMSKSDTEIHYYAPMSNTQAPQYMIHQQHLGGYDTQSEQEINPWGNENMTFTIMDKDLNPLQTIKNDNEDEIIQQMVVYQDQVYAVTVSKEAGQKKGIYQPRYTSIKEVDIQTGQFTEIERFDHASPQQFTGECFVVSSHDDKSTVQFQFFEPKLDKIVYHARYQAKGDENQDVSLIPFNLY